LAPALKDVSGGHVDMRLHAPRLAASMPTTLGESDLSDLKITGRALFLTRLPAIAPSGEGQST
jgi:hypothetical protein